MKEYKNRKRVFVVAVFIGISTKMLGKRRERSFTPRCTGKKKEGDFGFCFH